MYFSISLYLQAVTTRTTEQLIPDMSYFAENYIIFS